MIIALGAFYEFIFGANAKLQSSFLLAVRLYWGWLFAVTGWGKISNIEKVVGFFTSLNIPMPWFTAHCIAGLELVGGSLLFLGLFSRPIALLLSINMIVALLLADFDAVRSIFSDPDKFIAAAPFSFLFASMIVLFFGAGCYSLDRLTRIDNIGHR